MTRVRRDTRMRTVAVEDVSRWDDRVRAQPRGTIFGASGRGVCTLRGGARIERPGIVDALERLPGVAQIQIRQRGPLRQVVVQGGPRLTREGERRRESVIPGRLVTAAAGRVLAR